jgi:hypothetical protein
MRAILCARFERIATLRLRVDRVLLERAAEAMGAIAKRSVQGRVALEVR